MKRPAFLAIALILSAHTAFASAKGDVEKGNMLYNDGKYDDAFIAYEKAASDGKFGAMANFNAGAALYGKKAYSRSVDSFNKAIASGDDGLVARADYNIGNAYYRMGAAVGQKAGDLKKPKESFETALKFYKRAMDLDPDDMDAKFNYEFVSMVMSQPDGQQQQDQQDKKEEKDQQRDKDKQQDQKDDKGQGQDQKQQEDRQQSGSDGELGQGQGRQGDQKDRDGQQKDQKGQEGDNNSDRDRQETGGQGERGDGKEEEPEDKERQDQSGKGSGGEESKDGGEEDSGKGGQSEEDSDGGTGRQEAEETPAPPEEREGGQGDGGEGKNKGLEFYQSPSEPVEPGQMTEQEARMLLEGYKGEEATGRAVRMRKQPMDISEPSRDW